jgi:hypothetical protein
VHDDKGSLTCLRQLRREFLPLPARGTQLVVTSTLSHLPRLCFPGCRLRCDTNSHSYSPTCLDLLPQNVALSVCPCPCNMNLCLFSRTACKTAFWLNLGGVTDSAPAPRAHFSPRSCAAVPVSALHLVHLAVKIFSPAIFSPRNPYLPVDVTEEMGALCLRSGRAPPQKPGFHSGLHIGIPHRCRISWIHVYAANEEVTFSSSHIFLENAFKLAQRKLAC